MTTRSAWNKWIAVVAQSLTVPTTFRALANRPFALLCGGQTLSRVGDFLYQVALAWWVLEQTGSAASMATLLIVSFAPTLLLLLIGGVAVDRHSRVQIMLASDVLRGVVVSVVAVLAMGDLLQLWHLYALNLVFGIVDAFFQPAYAAAVPELVSDDDLSSANALSSMSVQVGRIAGPALGATIVALGGAPFAFALNGLTFFVAAALLVPLLRLSVPRRATPAQGNAPQPKALADLREGISTVLTTPWLWLTILVFAFSNVMLGGPYGVALPLLVRAHLRAEVGTLGLLSALFAAGYVIGGLWLGQREQLHQRGQLVYGGMAVAGLALGVFGLPVPLVVLGIAAVINGAALEISSLAWTSALQQRIPRKRLGRIASVDALGSFALIPVGYGIAGWATDALGAPIVFAVGGGLTAIVAALVRISYPAIRELD